MKPVKFKLYLISLQNAKKKWVMATASKGIEGVLLTFKVPSTGFKAFQEVTAKELQALKAGKLHDSGEDTEEDKQMWAKFREMLINGKPK